MTNVVQSAIFTVTHWHSARIALRCDYGGSGIAASTEVAERVTERPLMWMTTQFLTNTAPGE